MAKRLTAASIEREKADPSKRLEIGDELVSGLYLVIQPSGAKSWALRYRANGISKKLTIGSVLFERTMAPPAAGPALGAAHTLAEARTAAKNALQAVAEGYDPYTAKKAAAAALEAGSEEQLEAKRNAAERYLVRTQGAAFIERWCKQKKKNRSWPEVERQFKVEIYPTWGNRDVRDITKADVNDLLDRIVDRGSPITANRVFATLSTFFRWLSVDRSVIADSPVEKMTKPELEEARTRFLSDSEVRLFWAATAELGEPFGDLFRLLLLTGQRRQEVAGMMRAELSAEGPPLWIIPIARAKNKREHHVPLSPLAVEIIERQKDSGNRGLVFTTNGDRSVSGFSRAKIRLDAIMLRLLHDAASERGDDASAVKPIDGWTLHDLRRTAATGMAALDFLPHIVEVVLNHVGGFRAGVAGKYNRHAYDDEKRKALNAWADRVKAIVGENVVQLPRRQPS